MRGKLRRGLGAGMCDAHTAQWKAPPRLPVGVAQSLALSCSSSDLSFGHIYFLASCLYMCELCLGKWGEKEKHRMGGSRSEILSVEKRIKATLMHQKVSGPAPVRPVSPRPQMALLGKVIGQASGRKRIGAFCWGGPASGAHSSLKSSAILTSWLVTCPSTPLASVSS